MKLYRYVEDFTECDYKIVLNEYEVIKTTPCGFWIKKTKYSEKKTFVLNGQGKRFAHSSMSFALEYFTHRKAREIALIKSRLKWASKAKAKAIEMKNNNQYQTTLVETFASW